MFVFVSGHIRDSWQDNGCDLVRHRSFYISQLSCWTGGHSLWQWRSKVVVNHWPENRRTSREKFWIQVPLADVMLSLQNVMTLFQSDFWLLKLYYSRPNRVRLPICRMEGCSPSPNHPFSSIQLWEDAIPSAGDDMSTRTRWFYLLQAVVIPAEVALHSLWVKKWRWFLWSDRRVFLLHPTESRQSATVGMNHVLPEDVDHVDWSFLNLVTSHNPQTLTGTYECIPNRHWLSQWIWSWIRQRVDVCLWERMRKFETRRVPLRVSVLRSSFLPFEAALLVTVLLLQPLWLQTVQVSGAKFVRVSCQIPSSTA